jgi:site-specific recombinase XerD
MNNFAQQTLSDYLELFLQYIAEAKNASPKTIENYNLRLGRFARFVGEIEPKAITAFMVLNFRMHLKKQDLSMKTINYHIVALRSFLKFLLRNDIDTLNPEKCDLAKIDPREVSYLTESELESLLAAPYQFETKPLAQARDAALLAFLFSTGLRVSELIALTKDRIRPDSNQLTVIGK